MLAAIQGCGVPAPAVLAMSDRVLVLEERPHDGRLGDAWADLGRCLGRLHGCTGQRYGWEADYAFGSLAIPNRWQDHWPSFWAERRLLPHLSHLPPTLARRLEALATDLPHRLPARPPASLLHGDMWGGNVLVADGRVTGLIDPACYYGHSEVDLAMLGLFDRPTAVFQAAYGPLEPGAGERLMIYRLWPALVHLRLFGAGYRALVEGILDALGV
jgi:fructosamine-3-kinase